MFDLCGKIWGGSPATVQIGNGLESADFGNVSAETDECNIDQGINRRVGQKRK
jgi:hypothetical protein